MGEITNTVQRAPRRCASAWETSVEGTLRRAPVPDQTSRDTSLRVEGTLRDRVAHDHLLEQNERAITISESARASASVRYLKLHRSTDC